MKRSPDHYTPSHAENQLDDEQGNHAGQAEQRGGADGEEVGGEGDPGEGPGPADGKEGGVAR